MATVNRSRSALSPIPQNQSTEPSAASGSKNANKATSRSTTSDRTRRSLLRAKSAHTGSTLLPPLSPVYHSPVVVELPTFVARPANPMQSEHIRAGLKRKKGAPSQLAAATRSEKHSDRSSGSLSEPRNARYTIGSSASLGLGRVGPLTARRRKNKDLDLAMSPHLPRDKPSSSASEPSDWSSVASLSPGISRPSPSRTEDFEASAQSRPRIQTRRSSRNSLHRTLDGMSLEDSAPATGLGSRRSSRSQSQSRSRQSSNCTAADTDPLPSRSHSHPLSRSSPTPDSDHSSSGSVDMDDDEAEHARLVSSAPTWQLHRLRKDELIQLSLTAGAWDVAPTEDQLELLTKQDLVNRIITYRSRLDRFQVNKRQTSVSGWALPQRRNVSESAFDQQSEDEYKQDDEASESLWMRGATRRVSQRLIHRSDRTPSSNSADGQEADLTDASNEAGGEETEAEPQPPPNLRQFTGRTARPRRKAEGTLRRMDSSTFDELEPSKAHQAPRRQLRDKTSLRGASGRRMRRANGSEAVSASTSSSIFGGRSSRASNASHSPFVQRHQLNVFVASSPIRTRSRTARLMMGLPTRRKAGAREFGAADAAFPALDPMATPKLGNRRPQRTKKAVKFRAASPSIGHDEDEWMEDASSGSEAVSAALQSVSADALDEAVNKPGHHSPRRVLRPRRLTADSDTSLMSSQPRSRSASTEGVSDSEGGSQSNEQDEADGMHASEDDAPTPTKFRKLRNGKLRLDAASSQAESDAPRPVAEQVDDVDMVSASGPAGWEDNAEDRAATKGRGRNRRTESPESDTSPSDSPENAMVQPSYSLLARLKKLELEELCLHREINIDQEDKKANLIKKLLDWHLLNKLEAADGHDLDVEGARGRTEQNNEDEDADDNCSDVSAATATAEHSAAKAAQRTPTRRRNTRAASGTHPAATDSDQPLLLRAHGKTASSAKLPTPPLTSNNEEANPPQAGDGVDELNGLDLESLNLTDKEIHPSKLEKLEKIGSGGFKDVYVGKYRISKTRVNKVAIADIRDQLTEMDIKELSLLRDLRHENIVRFIGVSIPEDPRHVPCMIVSELCSNGDLFDYIRNTSAPRDAEVFRILLETARGLEYLHTRTPAIIHRDCKSTNVLITRRKTAKINDFGLARVKNTSRSMMRSLVGTVNWQAVELWVPKPHYNEKVDVWSAAMTFWEVLQWHQPEKKYPFQGMNEHQIYQDVGQKRQRPYTGFIRRQFGGEIVDLLDRMWDHTPKNRPSMTEVCNELEALVQMKKEAPVTTSGRGKA